jgi:sec-independent protein translocase protein TatA
MGSLGGGELLIILLIVVVLFGVGRVSKRGGELGQAVSSFRRGMRDSDSEDKAESTE